jgi:hypothetical protein
VSLPALGWRVYEDVHLVWKIKPSMLMPRENRLFRLRKKGVGKRADRDANQMGHALSLPKYC